VSARRRRRSPSVRTASPKAVLLPYELYERYETIARQRARLDSALSAAQSVQGELPGPFTPGYDLSHLCAVYRRIFGDIYHWAGQIGRSASPGASLFCLPQHIETSGAEVFRSLRSENCLRDLDREAFVARLAYYLGEVNVVRPFREGTDGPSSPCSSNSPRGAGYNTRLGSRVAWVAVAWPISPSTSA
jgi:fido (protein-threonine AMPylation protein)